MGSVLNVAEFDRIRALHNLKILDTPPEERFDRITKIAQIMFDVPIALVSLVDENRQWFKSCAGLSVKETPRSMSFCSHAILNEDVMFISDATNDKRFSNNPLVTGEPHIRFYAGKPIRDPDGKKLGTLCIIDTKPRLFSRADKSVLIDLANWVESEFKNTVLTNSLKNTAQDLELAQQDLLKQNEHLAEKVKEKTEQLLKNDRLSTIGSMASRIAHDIRNPLSVIQMSSDFLKITLEKNMDDKMKNQWTSLQNSILEINHIIEDVLNYAKTTEINLEFFYVSELLKNSIQNMNIPKTVNLILPEVDSKIKCDSRKIQAVFSNLITNSIQVMNASGQIIIKLVDTPEKISISFEDSGPGIPDDVLPRIFDHLFTTKPEGTGLGLGICKSIIEQHDGIISVKNNPTTFTIELPKLQ
ncbi:MAG: GAF domain-containing sensor histidine kinase [Nitrosopumilus sp.]|nr:GAF domain-containing sensor histidine kinase [Nitrosopumilus sp.]